MERSERTGFIVSGIAHAGAILWLVLGGVFFSHDLPPPVETAEVSLMSEAEFAALNAAAPTAPVESAPEPSLPDPAPVEETPPPPEPETVPEPAAPAEPEPQPDPDPAPDVTELTPPEAEVEDTPPTPPTPPGEVATDTPLPEPQPDPQAAPRVGPVPTEAPEENVDVAPEAMAETAPEPAEDPVPQEPEEAVAPPETGQVLETEANREQTELASAAPMTSPRPRKRPERAPEPEPEPAPAPASEPQPEPAAAEPEPDTAPAEDAVADALAAALAGAAAEEPAPGTGTAPSGPPLTGGEKDALVIAVKQCWNVGALSTDALRTVVTVGVGMDPSGRPISGSIRMIGSEGGTDASAQQAFEAGRRAIIRCGANGFPLPPEKYDQWREVEIVFNPENMRMR